MSIPEQFGDYHVIEEIGRGGFGIVYRAHQKSLDRPVALKVLYRHLIHTQEQISRFEREARAAARLDHPCIVSVYAWGEANDDFYIAQRLIGSGRTLADELDAYRSEGAVPKGWFRKVAKDLSRVADGLAQAHDRGIVHRDVKPSNVLLDDDLEPSLGDFGLAKVEDGLELSRTGDFAGSPYYMSPEQADSRVGPVDHRSDVYSLGVTLYEMLTLTQPFQGTSSAEIMRKILAEDPRPPTKVESRVPRDLETICLKAMEKNPARRYPSAIEFANDLRAFLDGEPISAVPIGRTRRLVRRARRHSAVLTGVVLTVVFAGVLYFALAFKSDERDQMEQTLRQGAKSGMVKEAGEFIQERRDDIEAEAVKQIEEARQQGDEERAAEIQANLQTELASLDATYDQLVDQAQRAVEGADAETLQNIATEVFSGGGIFGALKAAGMAAMDGRGGQGRPDGVAVPGGDPGALAKGDEATGDEGEAARINLSLTGFRFDGDGDGDGDDDGTSADDTTGLAGAQPTAEAPPVAVEPPSATAPGTAPESRGFFASLFDFGGGDDDEESDTDTESDDAAPADPSSDDDGTSAAPTNGSDGDG